MYEELTFPHNQMRPFFYTCFVSSIDGKVIVRTNPYAYWPIGSSLDHDVLIELRSRADLLIQGKNTALFYRTLDSLAKVSFQAARRALGKESDLPYLVISKTADPRLLPYLHNPGKTKPFLVTTETAVVSDEIIEASNLLRYGTNTVDIQMLVAWLQAQGFQNVMVEVGPTLLGAFFAQNLIDEVFLTIAPKIFGNSNDATFTVVEGYLFPPDHVQQCRLLSVKQEDDELFLRYSMRHEK